MGCDCTAKKGRRSEGPWKRQIAALKIPDADAISDSGVEIWNLLASRGIDNVILCGVHTNMCVLGRPFGLRQMAKNGKNVVLMRDMTDTMYNPEQPPGVATSRGRSWWSSTSEVLVPELQTSDITGKPAFRFKGDARDNHPLRRKRRSPLAA